MPVKMKCHCSKEIKPVIAKRMREMTREAAIQHIRYWRGKIARYHCVTSLFIQLSRTMILFTDIQKAIVYLRSIYRKLDDGYCFAVTVFNKEGTWHLAGKAEAYLVNDSSRWTEEEMESIISRTDWLAEQTCPYPMSGGTPRSDYMRQLALNTTICRVVDRSGERPRTDSLRSFQMAEQILFDLMSQELPRRTTTYGVSVLAPATDFSTRRKNLRS